MKSIPDFNQNELWVVKKALEERYGKPVDIELAESELRLDPDSSELTPCPTVFWQVGDCNFVVFKVGERSYRCGFFYSIREQYGTGIDQFDDLSECVVILLQVQADHEAQRKK